jgi:hypothetical protein
MKHLPIPVTFQPLSKTFWILDQYARQVWTVIKTISCYCPFQALCSLIMFETTFFSLVLKSIKCCTFLFQFSINYHFEKRCSRIRNDGLDSNFHGDQCSGSGSIGSVNFWVCEIRIRNFLYWPGFFHQQAKNYETLDFYSLWLLHRYDNLLSLKTDVNLLSNKQWNKEENLFLLASCIPLKKRAGSGSRSSI